MSTPYGAWPSPLSPADVAAGGRRFGGVAVADGTVTWLERRPTEGGRGVIVRTDGDTGDGAPPTDLTPEEYDVRTLVHEYGGGDFLVADGTCWFANFEDQRLYRQPVDAAAEEAAPEPVTPEPDVEQGDRYADLALAPDGETLYAVRERHAAGGDGEQDTEPTNELVRLPADGGDGGQPAAPTVVASGHDFYAAPRPSPDGDRLAYLAWDHPAMPWDETRLYVAAVDDDGDLRDEAVVLGGNSVSVVCPKWGPEGTLHAVADPDGWWNLYRVGAADAAPPARAARGPENLFPAEAEFGVPQWVFGLSTYAFLDDGRIAVAVNEGERMRMALLRNHRAGGDAADLAFPDLPYTAFHPAALETDGERLGFVGGRPTAPDAVVEWDPGTGDAEPGEPRRLREAMELDLDPDLVSEPEAVTFPTGDERGATDAEAHAHYYPPTNPDVEAPDDERPPLVVTVHGGPTSQTHATLDLTTQFFTSRGFAVADVNYRGSTGYGRPYRESLRGEWGVRDVLDCVHAAESLADEGRVDGDRLAVRGGSAGGYATLAALAFHDAFDAGASYYGVADLEALAAETHKFESRYLDGLVGPLPEAEDVYRERSPVHHADGVDCPLLLLQGGEDRVVPPSQAERMIDALVENETPYAYVEFPEERHGFREAENVARAHAAELDFYGQVFGFAPADDLDPVELVVGEDVF